MKLLYALPLLLTACATSPQQAIQDETHNRVDVHHANMFKPYKNAVAVPAGGHMVGNCGDFTKTAISQVPGAIAWPCITNKGVSHVFATNFVYVWDARFSEVVTFQEATRECK